MNGESGRAFDRRFLVALVAEAIYIAVRNAWGIGGERGIVPEMLLTAWRVPFVFLYLGLARDVVRNPAERRPVELPLLLWIVVAVDTFAGPLSSATSSLDWGTRITLALTSPIVAMREELFYRAILQRALERRFGPLPALVAASALFVVYHVGAQPMNLLNCTWIFATGMILGVIFQRTRNIWIPIALHTAIDVAYALVPALGWISWSTAFLCNVAIMCAVLAWWAITTTEDRRR